MRLASCASTSAGSPCPRTIRRPAVRTGRRSPRSTRPSRASRREAFAVWSRAIQSDPDDEELLGPLLRLAESQNLWGELALRLDELLDDEAVPPDVEQTYAMRLGQIAEDKLADLDRAAAAFERATRGARSARRAGRARARARRARAGGPSSPACCAVRPMRPTTMRRPRSTCSASATCRRPRSRTRAARSRRTARCSSSRRLTLRHAPRSSACCSVHRTSAPRSSRSSSRCSSRTAMPHGSSGCCEARLDITHDADRQGDAAATDRRARPSNARRSRSRARRRVALARGRSGLGAGPRRDRSARRATRAVARGRDARATRSSTRRTPRDREADVQVASAHVPRSDPARAARPARRGRGVLPRRARARPRGARRARRADQDPAPARRPAARSPRPCSSAVASSRMSPTSAPRSPRSRSSASARVIATGRSRPGARSSTATIRDRAALEELARLYRAAGQKSELIETLEPGRSPDQRDRRGEDAARRDRAQLETDGPRAVAAWQAVLDLDPDDLSALSAARRRVRARRRLDGGQRHPDPSPLARALDRRQGRDPRRDGEARRGAARLDRRRDRGLVRGARRRQRLPPRVRGARAPAREGESRPRPRRAARAARRAPRRRSATGRPRSPALARAADVWESQLDNPDAAGEILEKILKREPGSVAALTRLSKIYERSGRLGQVQGDARAGAQARPEGPRRCRSVLPPRRGRARRRLATRTPRSCTSSRRWSTIRRTRPRSPRSRSSRAIAVTACCSPTCCSAASARSPRRRAGRTARRARGARAQGQPHRCRRWPRSRRPPRTRPTTCACSPRSPTSTSRRDASTRPRRSTIDSPRTRRPHDG